MFEEKRAVGTPARGTDAEAKYGGTSSSAAAAPAPASSSRTAASFSDSKYVNNSHDVRGYLGQAPAAAARAVSAASITPAAASAADAKAVPPKPRIYPASIVEAALYAAGVGEGINDTEFCQTYYVPATEVSPEMFIRDQIAYLAHCIKFDGGTVRNRQVTYVLARKDAEPIVMIVEYSQCNQSIVKELIADLSIIDTLSGVALAQDPDKIKTLVDLKAQSLRTNFKILYQDIKILLLASFVPSEFVVRVKENVRSAFSDVGIVIEALQRELASFSRLIAEYAAMPNFNIYSDHVGNSAEIFLQVIANARQRGIRKHMGRVTNYGDLVREGVPEFKYGPDATPIDLKQPLPREANTDRYFVGPTIKTDRSMPNLLLSDQVAYFKYCLQFDIQPCNRRAVYFILLKTELPLKIIIEFKDCDPEKFAQLKALNRIQRPEPLVQKRIKQLYKELYKNVHITCVDRSIPEEDFKQLQAKIFQNWFGEPDDDLDVIFDRSVGSTDKSKIKNIIFEYSRRELDAIAHLIIPILHPLNVVSRIAKEGVDGLVKTDSMLDLKIDTDPKDLLAVTFLETIEQLKSEGIKEFPEIQKKLDIWFKRLFLRYKKDKLNWKETPSGMKYQEVTPLDNVADFKANMAFSAEAKQYLLTKYVPAKTLGILLGYCANPPELLKFLTNHDKKHLDKIAEYENADKEAKAKKPGWFASFREKAVQVAKDVSAKVYKYSFMQTGANLMARAGNALAARIPERWRRTAKHEIAHAFKSIALICTLSPRASRQVAKSTAEFLDNDENIQTGLKVAGAALGAAATAAILYPPYRAMSLGLNLLAQNMQNKAVQQLISWGVEQAFVAPVMLYLISTNRTIGSRHTIPIRAGRFIRNHLPENKCAATMIEGVLTYGGGTLDLAATYYASHLVYLTVKFVGNDFITHFTSDIALRMDEMMMGTSAAIFLVRNSPQYAPVLIQTMLGGWAAINAMARLATELDYVIHREHHDSVARQKTIVQRKWHEIRASNGTDLTHEFLEQPTADDFLDNPASSPAMAEPLSLSRLPGFWSRPQSDEKSGHKREAVIFDWRNSNGFFHEECEYEFNAELEIVDAGSSCTQTSFTKS